MANYTYAEERREAVDLLFVPSWTVKELLVHLRGLEWENRGIPYWRSP